MNNSPSFDRTPTGAKDVFVHFADFERAGLPRPEVDERYSFEIEETERGLRATNIAALD